MKNYVIIGGSSGIGSALVHKLEQDDVNIIATYNTNVPSETSSKFSKFDVTTDTFNIDTLPEEIHGLVYCPGSINLKPFHRFKSDDFINDFKLQVVGATTIIQQLLPRLKKSGSASIVLFSTVAVQQGFNFHSQVATSKGAIEGLTRALAAEFAPLIRVNAIAPSLTNTDLAGRLLNSPEKIEKQAAMNPMKRVGDPKDIAALAHFLLTEEASWITGQIVHVDGGFSVIKH